MNERVVGRSATPSYGAEIKLSTQGRLSVDAVLCHANMETRFTERKTETYPLETGTYDWREQEIIIEPDRPLRSIQLSLHLCKFPSTAWVDDLFVAEVP